MKHDWWWIPLMIYVNKPDLRNPDRKARSKFVNMPRLTCLILAGMVLFSMQCFAQDSVPPSTERPNVLFIIVDDLRTDLDRFYTGGVKTPAIDRLATQSVRFTDSYANVPVCGASRASFLTGIRPAPDRFIDYDTRVDEDAPGAVTLPQAFKEQGYVTHGIGKVFHHTGDAQQSWSLPVWNPAQHSNNPGQSWRNYVTPQRLAWEREGVPSAFESAEVPDNAYYDGQQADRAIAFLERQSASGQPFFLALGFVKPHLPYNAPTKYWEVYDPSKIVLTDVQPPETAPKQAWHSLGEIRYYREVPAAPEVIGPEVSRQLIHGYIASASYTDAQIGRVLDALDASGLSDNTIVVLTSDHGYSLGEHELWVKHSTYRVAMQTPLMFRVPGLEGGSKREGLTEHVDLFPTIVDLAGIEAPADQLQGESLKPRLFDSSLPGKPAIFPRWKSADVVHTGQFLYTEWLNKEGQITARMLYEHDSDLDERVNLAGELEYAATVEDLSGQLKRQRETLR